MANLKELFPEFYQTNLSVLDLSNTSENLIVFDTNYLLDIIQLPTTVSKKYIEALEKVKDNIYIPYLVALEFNFKKSSIKKNKMKEIKKYQEQLENSISQIKNNIDKIDLVDKSEKQDFTKDMLDLTEDFSQKLLDLAKEKINSIITKEETELYDKLIAIIENKIGDKYTQDWILEIEEDGKKRYENKIPPGFNDESKEDENDAIRRYGDIYYQRKYGDLLIWKDIINYSKNYNKLGKKVIFITNDGLSNKKSDLLYKVNNLTVGPNISLMNELQMEATKEFHILSNLRFVQLVNDLSDAEMSKLKSFSETKYMVKIPKDLIEEELKKIKELNSKNTEFQFDIDDEGYLFKNERKKADENHSIENATQRALLQILRNRKLHEQQSEENYINNLIKKQLPESDNYEKQDIENDLISRLKHLEKYLAPDELRNKLSNYYNSDLDDERLDDEK